MIKKLLMALALCVTPLAAQTVFHYPAVESNNTFTGSNTFNTPIVLPSLSIGNCMQVGTGNVVSTTTAPCPVIAGQVTGYLPLAGSSFSLSGPSHLDDGITFPGSINSNIPINMPAAVGYKQNAGNPGRPPAAIAHNRDQVTAVFAMPQDFCVNAGTGPPFDDTPCFNKAIRWLASQNNNSSKTLYVPWTANGYYFANEGAQFLYTLPYDFGDYNGSASFITPASASVYFTNGQLTSCAIQGGTGYAPSAQLPIQILDPEHRGSGAAAYVLTDSTGAPASACVVQLAGMNYPQVGVNAIVIPLGGDGATGTCSLVSGSFTSPCTVATGGSGYSSTLKPQVNMAGLTCTTYPVLTPTIASAAVTAVTTTAGSVCSYASSSTATVPMQFGASCGGTQCTLLAPETPVNLPLSVALLAGVQIVGVGNPIIQTHYSLSGQNGPTFTEPIAFGDPWGDQTGAIRVDLGNTDLTANRPFFGPSVSGIQVYAQIGFAFPLLAGGTFDNITCRGGLCFYVGNTQSADLGTFRLRNRFTNDRFLGVSGILVGGDWHSRGPNAFAGGNYGGTFMVHNPVPSGTDSQLTGSTGGINVENAYMSTAAVSGAPWDVWVEQFIWKAQNSPATPTTDGTHLLSNTSTTCVQTLSFSSRAIDDSFGYTVQNSYQSYPWSSCYRGVFGGLVNALPRYGVPTFAGATGITSLNNTFVMSGVRVNGMWRPLFMGYAGRVDISDVFTAGNNAASDPYLPGGVTNAGIWLASTVLSTATTGDFEDINTGTTLGLRSLYFGMALDNGNLANSLLSVRNVSNYVDQSIGSVVTANLVTTAATSDTVSVTNLTSRGHCQLTATNASAATNFGTTFISAVTAGQITVTHTATSGMDYTVACTKYF